MKVNDLFPDATPPAGMFDLDWNIHSRENRRTREEEPDPPRSDFPMPAFCLFCYATVEVRTREKTEWWSTPFADYDPGTNRVHTCSKMILARRRRYR